MVIPKWEVTGCYFPFWYYHYILASLEKQKREATKVTSLFNRDGKIRTCDLLDPNQALYRTKPHPECDTSIEKGYKVSRFICQNF